MHTLEEKVESLIRNLPDERGARVFLERLTNEHPRTGKTLFREPGLLSDVLTLAAWSPLLATTLEQNPDYITWLMRERVNPRVRNRDELKESLARFALTRSSLNPPVLLARFRRRELLRIYLHDIRRLHTLVETTEELSNLADAILEYALSLATQELDNRYGPPRRTDERGRIATAEFCIVALGKLGSLELNYASDIDLVFFYSDEGTTAGSGSRDAVTNREYFNKLAELVAKLVGQQVGEGGAYRVDLRLRPHGRDGALACSLAEAVRYYHQHAQPWELQALIRARGSAGSATLFNRFNNAVRARVFRRDISVSEALESVRLAKQKIDKKIEREGAGFNVKLSRGGIREIEFIAQALQLAHGGNDDWLRAPHTLISLGRLADRQLITETEHTRLSDAYVFLRLLEHRLQMEQGLQTHTVPQPAEQRELVARRMHFTGPEPLELFDTALTFHTTNVRLAYSRIFKQAEGGLTAEMRNDKLGLAPVGSDADTNAAYAAAAIFATRLSSPGITAPTVARVIQNHADRSLNRHRSLTMVHRVASSLEKSDAAIELDEDSLAALVRLCGTSDFFGEIVASNPALVTALGAETTTPLRRDYRALLRAGIDRERSFSAELSALRRTWSRLLIEIGARDAAGAISVAESNRLQTELAIASCNVAYLIARRELVRRFGNLAAGPRIAILGLGRLGSGGVDYGSDLDIIITYDSLIASPVALLTQDQAYARLGELLIAALSSVTREGYLYRVDLRLRPDGKNGPLASGSEAFREYLRERTAVWEWLAYVKLRAIAGDLELGRMLETHARHAVHEAARRIDPEELRVEARRVRERLEREKGARGARGGIDIKYGSGGMLDVYFAARYLQLRDDVRDEGEDRSTQSTLERLELHGSLQPDEFLALRDGYSLLRSVDHHLRLILGRSGRMPAAEHPAVTDIAKQLGLASAAELTAAVAERMKTIRAAYESIME
ncbi:MAG TPA: hypothetical protein VMM84_03495 [Pyrinomonadaceae bacterium]|nr:hypothetical protein [Pyrinomonadaceae bacterium]